MNRVKRRLLSREDVQRAAQQMLGDYAAHRPNEIFAKRGTNWLTLEEAYAVQRSVADLREQRGERCVGYKVGCVSSVIQSQLGLNQPVRGYLWSSEAFQSGCQLAEGRFANLAIEGEIALRLRRDIPNDFANSGNDLCDFIECWFPVIELHNHLFRGDKPTSQELVAGNAMHAGFVAPSEPGNQGLTVLNAAEIQVEIDGVLAEHKSVATLPRGPVESLRWLASALAPTGQRLSAGQIVLTGSPGRLIPIVADCSVTVVCEGQQVQFSCVKDALDRASSRAEKPNSFHS